MSKLLRREDIKSLQMFYLGMVAGSQLKNQIEFDDESASADFGNYQDILAVARAVASEDDSQIVLAVASATESVMRSGSPHESIMSAIRRNRILESISNTAARVNQHGNGSLDDTSIKALQKLLKEYLEPSE